MTQITAEIFLHALRCILRRLLFIYISGSRQLEHLQSLVIAPLYNFLIPRKLHLLKANVIILENKFFIVKKSHYFL